MTDLTRYETSGWYEITSEGQITLYFSAVDEGMTTGPGDTPANVQYKPRVLNPEGFSIRRAPQVWVWGSTSIQGAAFGSLELDNYDGAYNELLRIDCRDSVVTIKILPAASLLTGTAIASALTVCTAIIDNVSSDNEDHITITLKDTIARLDRSLPVRYNPPFVDSGAANNMIPLTFGACRNVAPLLIDSPNRIYQLHDENIPNVTLVADKAAPLDPHASPPQYVPALSGSGVQLQTLPEGKLTVDCSSYGTQSVIPGADDVLAGSGLFLGAWTGTPAVPPGWTWTNGAGSTITEVVGSSGNIFGTGKNAAFLETATVWHGGTTYGDYLEYASVLRGGYSYRLNFSLFGIVAAPSLDLVMVGGIIVATALSSNPKDYPSGYGTPIRTVANGSGVPSPQNFSLEFTVPAGATRNLYFIITTSTGAAGGANGTTKGYLYNITLEELGQYQTLPLSGIPMHNYFTEILVQRAGELAAIFNSSEAEALTLRDDGSVIPFGIHFDQPPNILDALREPLDSFGATMFTDNLGVLRIRRFIDPTDPAGSVLCDFDPTNMERPVQNVSDDAKGVTTLIGARRNQSVFGDADFVTDHAIVPQDVKTRFKRTSQFQRTSSASPAGQYSFAIGAPIFDSLFDEPDDAQDEIERMVGIFSPNIYADGTFVTGKRRQITFIARYDDPTKVGATVQCNVNAILFGEIIRFTYPNADGTANFVNQLGEVIAWDHFAFARKIAVTVEI